MDVLDEWALLLQLGNFPWSSCRSAKIVPGNDHVINRLRGARRKLTRHWCRSAAPVSPTISSVPLKACAWKITTTGPPAGDEAVPIFQQSVRMCWNREARQSFRGFPDSDDMETTRLPNPAALLHRVGCGDRSPVFLSMSFRDEQTVIPKPARLSVKPLPRCKP